VSGNWLADDIAKTSGLTNDPEFFLQAVSLVTKAFSKIGPPCQGITSRSINRERFPISYIFAPSYNEMVRAPYVRTSPYISSATISHSECHDAAIIPRGTIPTTPNIRPMNTPPPPQIS
jgi:hypothetical protein